jgi:hypothetical protein
MTDVDALRSMITRAFKDIQTEINQTQLLLKRVSTLNYATPHAALPESSFKLTILLSTK